MNRCLHVNHEIESGFLNFPRPRWSFFLVFRLCGLFECSKRSSRQNRSPVNSKSTIGKFAVDLTTSLFSVSETFSSSCCFWALLALSLIYLKYPRSHRFFSFFDQNFQSIEATSFLPALSGLRGTQLFDSSCCQN